jgi:hypothetical protein
VSASPEDMFWMPGIQIGTPNGSWVPRGSEGSKVTGRYRAHGFITRSGRRRRIRGTGRTGARSPGPPVCVARVTITVTGGPTGSDVVMAEHTVGPWVVRLDWPRLDPLTSRRNRAALARLEDLVECASG